MCMWPPSTTQCGFTGRFVLTSGFFTTKSHRLPPASSAWQPPASSRTASWSPALPKKASSAPSASPEECQLIRGYVSLGELREVAPRASERRAADWRRDERNACRIPANPVEEAFSEERRQRQLLAACASGAQKTRAIRRGNPDRPLGCW